ncbi:MAG: helix-turn-helix transcriptional regulator [Bacteroidota bacterium]
MNIWKLVIVIVSGIAIVQGLFLSLYILIRGRRRFLPAFFLSLMLLALTLRLSKTYFFFLFAMVPTWAVWIAIAGLWAIGPSFWLYTLSSRPTKIGKADYLHYIPSLIFVSVSAFAHPSWPLLPLFNAGAIVLLLYVAASFMLFKSEKWQGNKRRFLLFGTSIGLIGLIFTSHIFIGTIQSYTIGTVLTLIILYCINFMILRDRTILKSVESKSKKIRPDALAVIIEDIGHLFDEQKIYRKKGLTLATVAQELNHPVYLVSQAIKEHKNTKFNAFVNAYRVSEVKTRLKDLDANSKIEVIAKEVGFSSTASLYKAFKEQTHLTPQAYRKEYEAKSHTLG